MSHEESEQVVEETLTADVEMDEGAEADTGRQPEEQEAAAEDPEEQPEARVSFLSYLSSPMVQLVVGREEQAVLTAHQALLAKSPFLAEACAAFADDGSPRQISLVDDDVDAVGCLLEYLYTGEYFPRKLSGQRELEADPDAPTVDDTGSQLLKHARVYTIADKFGISGLKTLASSKIYCVNSSVKGEIEYARYVYKHTSLDDTTIRAPVARFWATRSHVLRAEAEDEFKALCLASPQFAYDVLSLVLDDKMKKERAEKMQPTAGGSARKRARHLSSGVA